MTQVKLTRATAKRFPLEEIEAADEENAGFCLACGAYHGCVEIDARNYECEKCGRHTVFGAGEIALRGLVNVIGREGSG